ncbi:MAG: hypothetical protein H7A41_01270 [Chlamydiales bacterium]|nr:hypothetical protein [Chlamydiales bacterium]
MKVIAHRGASLEAPENTLSAFKKAQEYQVDLIELDVHLTKDLIPVVIHDPMVDLDPPRPIQEMTLKEIRSIDVGISFSQKFAGEKIPTLKEVLELNETLMIEIKWNGLPFHHSVEPILQLVDKKHWIACLDLEVIKYVKKRGYKTIGVVESQSNLSPFIILSPEILALEQDLISPSLISYLHSLGIEAWGWTVDDPIKALELKKMGLDGLITNNISGIKTCLSF